MIFRTIAITTVIAGIVLTEGVVISFIDKKSTSKKEPAKVNNKKPQTTIAKSGKK